MGNKEVKKLEYHEYHKYHEYHGLRKKGTKWMELAQIKTAASGSCNYPQWDWFSVSIFDLFLDPD